MSEIPRSPMWDLCSHCASVSAIACMVWQIEEKKCSSLTENLETGGKKLRGKQRILELKMQQGREKKACYRSPTI